MSPRADEGHGASDNGFDDVSGFLHKAQRRSSIAMSYNSHVVENNQDQSDDDHFKVQQDDKALFFLKTAVILMLLVSAAIVGRATHMLITKGEHEIFQTRFSQDARSLLVAFESEVEKRVRVASILSTSITSFALGINAAWPLITIPDFQARTLDAMSLAGASALYFSPLVTNATKSAWEAYAGGRILRQVDGERVSETGEELYSPVFQVAPSSEKESLFLNQFAEETYSRALKNMIIEKVPTVTELNFEYVLTNNLLFVPVFDSFDVNRQVVGSLLFKCDWRDYFNGRNESPLVVVLENTCGQQVTFEVGSRGINLIGNGSLHDAFFGQMEELSGYLNMSTLGHLEEYSEQASTPTLHEEIPLPAVSSHLTCRYRIRIYPTQELYDEMHTQRPAIYAFKVAMQLFFFAGVLFIAYDFMIRKRQDEIIQQAAKSTALVESLFPSQVRDQVMESTTRRGDSTSNSSRAQQQHRRSTGNGSSTDEASDTDYSKVEGPPIANMFQSTTIMFADIAGFTAWSASREPNEVFTLLETLYGAFDAAAKRLDVFKVETIGDCYVAVVGLPKPRDDHAVVISRFAIECISSMDTLTKELEAILGPGTSSLGLRVGLHSGPVTAGVLRGDKSRFQLFGDSMNTTARIETSGEKGKVHVSESTASFIIAAGKQHWLTARAEPINAKGKGEMKTYWLKPRSRRRARDQQGMTRTANSEIQEMTYLPPQRLRPSSSGLSLSTMDKESGDGVAELQAKRPMSMSEGMRMRRRMSTGAISSKFLASKPSDVKSGWGFIGNDHAGDNGKKEEGLVNSNTKLLHNLLEQVLAYRAQCGTQNDISEADANIYEGSSIIDEVTEALPLAPFESTKAYVGQVDSLLSQTVKEQLQDYVGNISFLYHDNPFHNFEHASHVAQSANKLMQQIVTANYGLVTDEGQHRYSLGLSSDPLAKFAVVFAALIHDCNHQGVPNQTLVKEYAEVALQYNNRSPAEQNSVQVAWELLMESRYNELRQCIFPNSNEMHRFRQLIVNCVIATDIADSGLRDERKKRWADVFAPEYAGMLDGESMHRKATIVIDHIIQASDIAHTMQHWNIYIKWNEKLFLELYQSFKEGRSDVDPAENWYKGEIGFFNFYIIPLAKKLQECGVFGTTSDEFLTYAVENRDRWEIQGHQVIEGFIKRVNR